ncbi:hypothetical protein MLD38_000415 [Melastoma candidum]|uniref:Uncharacterized protein n=1 Tax=Melastoma candidum TaxID=119954 RepID=A0ACB9SIM1_9MYRT|nr:hypothetical protein MLD38_000415 [Melastoma candidum]
MLKQGFLFVSALVVGFLALLVGSRELPDVPIRERHEQWMSFYDRVYENSDEKDKRFEIFNKNVEYIKSFNKNGSTTYKKGINKFADWTEKEIREANYGFKKLQPSTLPPSTPFRYANVDIADASGNVNWVDAGAVTEIKNQENCGCCWAFSSVGAMEGIIQIKKRQLISLSEQELVDCMPNGGCSGNLMEHAFDYIISNNGLDTESNYPYQAVQGICRAQPTSAATITGYEFVPGDSEDDLLRAVVNQPISVAIDASGSDFVYYQGGVFSGPCGTDLNHAVTLVGYGTAGDGTDYWLIKNSWGTTWGEEGYMRIQRGVGGLCGITLHALYPTLT